VDDKAFWAVIAEARAAADPDDIDEVVGAIEEAIAALDDEELVAFHHQFLRQYWKCYRYEIRAAAMVIGGDEASEDFYDDFCCWLIAQGQERFDKTLADPDSLAALEIVTDDLAAGELLDFADRTYMERTGGEIPDEEGFQQPENPAGKPLTEADLQKKLPQLCNAFDYEVEEV
jgi:hypothetical protein